MRDVLISVAASFMIITFLYQPVRVEGTSMQPQLRDQDRLFINKFVYRFENISRGDIVVFHYPRDPVKSYIKRVIALPGDSLRIDGGRVYVNGERVDENYIPRAYRDVRSMPEMVIPQGSISSWATTAQSRATAATSVRSSGTSSTARRPLFTGLRTILAWFTRNQPVGVEVTLRIPTPPPSPLI